MIFWDTRQIDFVTFSSGIAHHNPVHIPCEGCRLFWFPLRHLLLPLENMFSQKALLTQVIQSIQCRVGPTCYSRQVPNMNWKYGYMHGLRLRWIRNFLRWDSEWNPALQTTEKISAQYCSECEAQDESGMSIEFTLLVFNMFAWILNRKSLSKVNSTIRMFNSSKAVFKVNFEKVSQGTILF